MNEHERYWSRPIVECGVYNVPYIEDRDSPRQSAGSTLYPDATQPSLDVASLTTRLGLHCSHPARYDPLGALHHIGSLFG